MKKILQLLTLLFTAYGFSQNIKLEGTVKDSLGVALEMANVMAVNKATNAMDAYAISNEDGKFQLLLKANTPYILKASYIGYTAFETDITTGSGNIVKHIVLKQGITLKELEIVHEMPVTIKGDTIVYNSDSFTNGTERKLEDVLRKLPGVEVNADGEVKVEGKTVSKLMVEGKDFFDGDTKLGVKNIPADALDKVEVLRNYNEVSQLRGLENNEENVAMNIKLKEGKKNFWFGDVMAGASIGEGERYIVNPKLFYYSPKYSINVIGNINNTGELPLTIQDYFKFTGGFRNMMRKGGTTFNIGSNDLGISLLRNNRAKNIETKFGAANFSYNPSKEWTLSGFAIMNSSRNELETKSRTQVLNPVTGEPETTQDVDEQSLQKSDFGLFKLSSSYKPNKNLHFDYDALLKASKQQEDNYLNQVVTPETSQSQEIFTDKSQNPVSLNQNLNLYYTLNDKNVFAFEMQHLYQDEDPFYNANLQENPFPDNPTNPSLNLGLSPVAGRYDISQERFVKTNKLDAKFDYYYMLTPKSNINVTLGNTYSYQTFNSNIFQILDDGSLDNLDENTRNDVSYVFNDVFLGLHYKFITGKFTFNPGVSFHRYNSYNEQLGTKVYNNFYRLLPDVYAQYQIKNAERLTYNYSMTTQFTDVTDFAQNLIFTSYSSLFRGNRYLENALYQSHSLSYAKYNMFNFTQIFGSLSYNHRMDDIKSLAGFNGINQISTLENSNFADESISGSAGYTRSFLKYYKASAGASISWNKFNNFRVNPEAVGQQSIANSQRQVSEQLSQNYNVSFSTNYKSLPNVEVGYALTINDYESNIFYNHRPFARMDYLLLNAFTITAEYEYNHYYNDTKTSDNEYDFLSAGIMYRKPESKWEFRVNGTNLLNTTTLNDDSFNQFSTRTSRYRVQPRYLLFSIRHNL
ncbi:TonB-dependent receptor [Flavobacterium cyanobacteriorum]|uniref:TonB-dependent receptor n=1 Tax=Flavobacterium cyanobacteriorum TaxID=2022802 RepID=A0A255ZAM4_9FLAO|nr:TonB-dependent receptor [Flavobacterium cyanobacteriorum]OYQ37934.1 TonB-dependent receptor [Flavobacterium cyanobacteriorum]